MKAFVEMYANESLRSQHGMKLESRDSILQVLSARFRVRSAGLVVIAGIPHRIPELHFREK